MNFISNVYNFVFFRKSCYSNLKVPDKSCPGMTQERELRVPDFTHTFIFLNIFTPTCNHLELVKNELDLCV